MRDKDQIILENAYLKTQKIIKEQAEDDMTFFAEDVDVDIDDYDFTAKDKFIEVVTYNLKADVKYKIEIEFRSWGIKDIYVNILSVNPIIVDYNKVNENGDIVEENQIKLDLSGIDIETEFLTKNSNQIIPQSLEIKVDKDYKPVSAKIYF